MTAFHRMRNSPIIQFEETFCKDPPFDTSSIVIRDCGPCDYSPLTNCGSTRLLSIWDKHNSGKWYPYLGNQALKLNTYRYSDIVSYLRETGNVDLMVNLHARAHTIPRYGFLQVQDKSLRILCNSCFRKTYNRHKVKYGKDELDMIAEVSVVKAFGETLDSVMSDLLPKEYSWEPLPRT